MSSYQSDLLIQRKSAYDEGHPNIAVGRSLLWSIVFPTIVAVIALVGAVGYYTPAAVVQSAIDNAVVHAEHSADQMKTLRTFYSENVVAKATSAGVKASPDYKGTQAIPVPTTFILDVAQAFSNNDQRMELVSPYPWPSRAGRVMDDFERAAWDYLTKNPSESFVRRETVNGRDTLRVAVADSMTETCVACHNNNPASPKKDWHVGDVRGLIEVERSIEEITQGANHLSLQLVGAIALVGAALLGVLLFVGARLVTPLRDLAAAIGGIGLGSKRTTVPHAQRNDELGTVARALVVLQEQSEERARAEAQIKHMAHHDALTDLPNRVQFKNELDHEVGREDQTNNIAICCLDLDHFKPVNDTLGHPVGDRLLRQIADRLSQFVDRDLTVARLGGDEFAVLCRNVSSPLDVAHLADAIIARISAPYDVDGHQLNIGVSIGIALHPSDGGDPDELLKNADLALYRAKTDGKGIHRFFEQEMDEMMQVRRSMELDLRAALAKGEFELHYQPLVNLAEKKICALEALLRWNHPVRGRVSPMDFIPVAEEIGAIDLIGNWVLRQACLEAATWPQDVKVAVNLSPVQFKNRSLVLHITSALAASGLSPNRLEIEITEALMLQDTDDTLATLHQLKALGVSISMDDFGTGYSSLSYLRKFPFDKIKIDKCFVSELSDADDSMAIVRAVTGLGASFGMSTTAEGVETREQLLRLMKEGCSEVQGYLFSGPRPAVEISRLFDQMRERHDKAA